MKTRQYAQDLCAAALNCLKLDDRAGASGRRPAAHWYMPIAKFGDKLSALNLATYRKYWAMPKN